MNRADAIVLVAPEYNHAMPGLLKHVLDSCLKEYVHKAAGIVAVSAGPFGGTRVIETALPVLRELGLVTIFWDVNVGSVAKVFDDSGRLLDPALVRRTDKFLGELMWMARTLRRGRESIALEPVPAEVLAVAGRAMTCPECGAAMNRHGEKLVYSGETGGPAVDPVLGGVMEEMHACPRCGYVASRRAG
jgi:ribosomal protein S27AE